MGSPNGIRPFAEADIPAVANLYNRVFLKTNTPAPAALQERFRRFYFQNPWVDPELPSLLYAEPDGSITAFLGLLPRPFSGSGRTIRVAVSSNFMVDPARRGGLAAIQLLKAFFDGPQDLSMAEGGDTSLKIWEAVGGRRVYVRSLNWLRLLRPAAYGLNSASGTSWEPVATLFKPGAWVADQLLAAYPLNPLKLAPSPPACTEIGADELLALYREDPVGAIRPVYDRPALEWLLRTLADKTSYGTLKSVVVRDGKGETLGWFVYYLNRKGASEVLQLRARGDALVPVIEAMLAHASRSGLTALSGQCTPTVMGPLSKRGAFFRNTGAWFLAHARDPELVRMLEQDQLSFSRLEGEWVFFRFAEGIPRG